MLGGLLKGLGKVFGTKSDKDIKALWPIVHEINKFAPDLQKLSHDELRGKTLEFKNIIAERLSGIDQEVAEIKQNIKDLPFDEMEERDRLFELIDEKEKERDQQLEVVLLDILPEAFAVIKETARRFSENAEIAVTASDYDKELSVNKDFVSIKGSSAVYKNEWTAAGTTVKWDMVHYDVQLIGGIVLHQGKIAEMGTGEGKTLVSTLPAYLNALGGRGVHIITVNDYLARRDCEWNGPIYQFHGLKVDCIDYHRPNSEERQEAYKADIVFGTNNEFGFDYLRDNMAHTKDDLVQQKLHFAMVDEVDSVLIDDARTPLIISGPVPRGNIQEFGALKPRIEKLVELQKKYINTALIDAKRLFKEGKTGEKDGGLALLRCFRGLPKNKALIKFLSEAGNRQLLKKTESYYLQDQQREMHKVDEELYFVIDERNNTIELTDRGIETLTQVGEETDFFLMTDVGSEVAEIEKKEISEDEKAKLKEDVMRTFSIKSERLHAVNQLLKAYTLFERDNEYIVQDGKVKIVDEQTGRVLDGRRYSDGLHQAIEAKENVKVEAATQTYATITLQNYFRMYHKLAGMTGTAETEAGEFWEIYKLDVVVIPTNRPIQRKDMDDLIYKTTREKYNAVIDHIEELTKQGRPVLVGTTSVEVSELLSRMMKLRRLNHNVLNAKQHQREAEIVAGAGQPGAVTIATNMAGRGTDIKITAEVKKAGGLAIVGTERHESRRVDRQLRGRAGRQGDPGSSQFFVSLEDNLMRLFGSDRASKIMDRLGYKEGEVLQHPFLSKNIERAQKKVEQNNFSIRKRLLEYDDVMNKQRTVVYSRRRNALFGERLGLDIQTMTYDWIEEQVVKYKEIDDLQELKLEFLKTLSINIQITEDEFKSTSVDNLVEKFFKNLQHHYKAKNERIMKMAYPVLKNIFEKDGERVKRVAVPFTDGIKEISITSELEETIKTEGRELVSSFEKAVTLSTIDDEWKEHLRELDDLKQAANNAVFEQKDPLLIYKLESFNLFKEFVSRMNYNVLSFLFKGIISSGDEKKVTQARDLPRKEENIRTSRTDTLATGGGSPDAPPAKAPQAPLKSEKIVGRNDPCPCGSGKKYKQCHGK
jgi:preprotein translocase subunit SecA